MYNDEMLNCLMENQDNGIIFVNSKGNIAAVNTNAKRMFGAVSDMPLSFMSNKIKRGDIVIICDTQIGEDDGNLTPDDLLCLGIQNPKIKADDTIIAIGKYQTNGSKAYYRFSSNTKSTGIMSLSENAFGHKISAKVDFNNRNASISVDGYSYGISFIMSVGFMVIIDGETDHVKFVQTNGYSMRKEGIKDILSEKVYSGMKSGQEMAVIGEKFKDLFTISECDFSIDELLSGKKKEESNIICDINKIKIVMTIRSVFDTQGVFQGVMLKFSEIDNILTVIKARNEVIDAIETQRKILFNRSNKVLDDNIFMNIIGNSTGMRQAKQMAYRASKRKDTVLITGESGTGKSLMAREIYTAGGKEGPFISVDCSTIPPSLFESEMFGYVSGAFTGASSSGKAGFFEAANRGTIFLDEIGEIPLAIQAKLLSVIQNKEIVRVGSTKPIPVDVRIIAATNRNLEEEVLNGNFRRDLYYRINVFEIALPPLRVCREDLLFMSQWFLDKECIENGLEKKVLSNDALKKIYAYDWPGNIRELENAIKRAALLCDDQVIYSDNIKINSGIERQTLKERLKDEEKRIILATLLSCRGDKKAAMEELGMSKTAFYLKLNEYRLDNDY